MNLAIPTYEYSNAAPVAHVTAAHVAKVATSYGYGHVAPAAHSGSLTKLATHHGYTHTDPVAHVTNS